VCEGQCGNVQFGVHSNQASIAMRLQRNFHKTLSQNTL
jgi:hypothetical protein